MFQTASPGQPMLVMPMRVQAAQHYLHYTLSKTAPTPLFDGRATEGVPLTAKEQAAYDAALEVLRQYFAGEMDYGDAPPIAPGRGEDGPSQPPVPAGV